MIQLAETFGCNRGVLPFAYLGLAVGTARPTIQDLTPIVVRFERRLSTTSCFFNQGCRLQLISSAFFSLPLHMLCSIHIPIGVIKHLERIIRQCLWRGNSDTPKQSLTAWEMICKPKNKGGLGITNFRHQNDALLMKFAHKFYNKEDTPWVNLV